MTDNSSVPSPSLPAPPSIPIEVSPVWLRLLVTIGVFCIYRLGCHIPLPGLDPNALGRLGPSSTLTPEHVSIFALGVIPIFWALALTEIAKLIVPPFGRWAVAERYNARRLNRIVRYIALVLAAFQALGSAGGLMQISGFVLDPDWTFRFVTVITLVAATALLGWLGDQITLHGFGNGFWLLLIAPSLMRLPEAVIYSAELLQVEDVSPSALAVAIGFIVVAVAVLVALAIAHARADANVTLNPDVSLGLPSGSPARLPGGAPGELPSNLTATATTRPRVPAVGRDILDVWPPMVAIYMSGLALFPIVFFQGNNSALGVGNPVRLVVIATLIALFSFLRTLSRPPADAWGWQLVKLTAAAQIVICVVAELLARYLDVPFAINGPWLILAVAIVMSAIMSNAAATSARQGVPLTAMP
jgi:preprotein translocase subunit SecY